VTKPSALTTAIFLLCTSAILAQVQETGRPEFEVASVKASPADSRGVRFSAMPGGRLSVRNNPLRNLLLNAFDVRNFQLAGLPSWVDSEHYDIDAKASGDPPREQMMEMLQALLADRFQLKVHRETKELPIFLLTAAKGGIKLQPWKEGSCIVVQPGQPLPTPAAGQPALKPCGSNIVSPKGPNLEWNAVKIDIVRLTMVLSSILGHRVIDNTGYTGAFDLHLEWSRNDTPVAISKPAADGNVSPPPADDNTAPSIFAVLQQQLGLKLEASKGPVEILVIDHLEKPSAN
jgi:uncharacterized protein (TIGR03435 family)